MSEKLSTFYAGARDICPILLGVIPFGLICGAVCVNVGMPEWGAVGMSTIIFAGAAQLAAAQLLGDNAPLTVVILTGLVINVRFLMYSASLAPHLKGLHPVKKAGLAYMLTDQAYAMSITRFTKPDGESVDKVSYYLGTAVLMWVAFNGTTLIGAYVGALIPAQWNLDFAIPLTFTALVIPAVKDKPTLLAAVVAGAVSYFADPLPYNLGLITAAMAGICVGFGTEWRQANG